MDSRVCDTACTDSVGPAAEKTVSDYWSEVLEVDAEENKRVANKVLDSYGRLRPLFLRVFRRIFEIWSGLRVVGLENLPGMSSDLHAKICWMHPRPLQRGNKYYLRQSTQTVQAIITGLESRLNIQSLEPEPVPAELPLNSIGEIRLKVSKPLIYDGYKDNRQTGSFILIEQGTNATVAAGMLRPPTEFVKPEYTDFAI